MVSYWYFPLLCALSCNLQLILSDDVCPEYPTPVPGISVRDIQSTVDALSANITGYLKQYKTPGGVAVGLVYDQELIWFKGFGLIDDADPQKGPPTQHTGFRIGSISKVFTDLMMLQLRDAGILPSLSEDITKYNHQFSVINPFGSTKRGISFHQLSCHLSGLPRNPPCEGLFVHGCNDSAEVIYKNLANMKLDFPPGLKPSYSNLGIGLLGRTLEEVLQSGQSWEDYVEKEILSPLSMKDSGTRMPPKSSTQMAVGYIWDGSVAEYIDMGWDGPAGNMYASTYDLAQLMMMLFRDNQTYNPSAGQILDGVTVREWMHPAYIYHDGFGFGLPWEMLHMENYTLVTKDGAINGYLAEFRMAPEIKTGVIVLQSSDNEAGPHTYITQDATSLILAISEALWANQPPTKLPPNAKEYDGNFTIKGSSPPTLASIWAYEDPPSMWAYIGDYWAGVSVHFIWRGNKDEFQLTQNGVGASCHDRSTGWDGAWVYFYRDAAGQVESFELPGHNYGSKWVKMPGSGTS